MVRPQSLCKAGEQKVCLAPVSSHPLSWERFEKEPFGSASTELVDTDGLLMTRSCCKCRKLLGESRGLESGSLSKNCHAHTCCVDLRHQCGSKRSQIRDMAVCIASFDVVRGKVISYTGGDRMADHPQARFPETLYYVMRNAKEKKIPTPFRVV